MFHSVPDLIAKIEDYLNAHNDDPKPFTWTATADDILAKVARSRVTLQAVNQRRETPLVPAALQSIRPEDLSSGCTEGYPLWASPS